MSDKIKKILKSLVFISIFLMLFSRVSNILTLAESSISQFYDNEDDSIDIAYIGSSNVLAHFNSTLAYKEYGFTTGMLTTNQQPFTAVEYLMKESQKTQNPQLYVIDIALIDGDFSTAFSEASIRNVTDTMNFSMNRIETIDAMTEYTPLDNGDLMSMYFNFLKYHSSWKDIYSSNFEGNPYIIKGHLIDERTSTTVTPIEREIWDYELYAEMNPDNQQVLESLLAYIEEENLNVIFVIPARHYTVDDMTSMNAAMIFLEDQNFEVINFNELIDDIGLDFSTDYYDSGHVNVDGATKYTLYFAEYLSTTYNLPDHRNDDAYNSWDDSYELYKEKYREYTTLDFEVLLEDIKEK